MCQWLDQKDVFPPPRRYLHFTISHYFAGWSPLLQPDPVVCCAGPALCHTGAIKTNAGYGVQHRGTELARAKRQYAYIFLLVPKGLPEHNRLSYHVQRNILYLTYLLY